MVGRIVEVVGCHLGVNTSAMTGDEKLTSDNEHQFVI